MKSITEEVLLQNMTDLEKLRANIYINSIQRFIENLRKNWKPKTLTVKGRTDDVLLYWDVYNGKWAIESTAFHGYVFKQLIRIMENSITMGNHKKKYTEPTILAKSVEMENTIAGSTNKEGEVSNA